MPMTRTAMDEVKAQFVRAVTMGEEAGFELLVCEVDDPSSRGHLALLA